MCLQPTKARTDNDKTLNESTFLSLPTEIHGLIASYLPYPDLLSLTLTHPIFVSHPLISTSKSQRVDWLLSRALKNLSLPRHSRCRWSSDQEFVDNPEVISILRKRRYHIECAEIFDRGHSGGGCVVVEGQQCPHLVEGMERLHSRWRTKFTTSGGRYSRWSWKSSRLPTWDASIEVLRTWQAAVAAVIVACVLYIVV